MSRSTEIAELMRKAANASTLSEQKAFVRQAEELKTEASAEHRAANAWNADEAVDRDTLVPYPVHEFHTGSIDSDWLIDLDTSFDSRLASQEMVAEASLWYGRVSDDVQSHREEYEEQARNLARRLSSRYGDASEVAERAFLDEASRLRTMAVKTGLVKEADTDGDATNPAEARDQAQLDQPNEDGMSHTGARTSFVDNMYDFLTSEGASTVPQVGDNGYPDATAFPSQNGGLPPEATSSQRAPVFQELQGNSQDVVPVNDPGLGQTDDLTGANEPRASQVKDHKLNFPVSGSKKESSMATCPTCGGHGRVAVRRTVASLPTIEDITKVGASGLDQIDQIADPKDNPSQTPYPDAVAFPWTLNPSEQVPAAIQQAEQQIAERQKRTGGRDNSGWLGDMGGRGTDYPGEQAPTGDASSSDGYADPVYGHGGDQGNQALLPYGHQEAADTTNQPNQWTRGMPTQDDQGIHEVTGAWREAVESDPHLASALEYVNQRLAAVRKAAQ